MVVNGSAESDWPAVADLARRFPGVIPAFGCHPWHLGSGRRIGNPRSIAGWTSPGWRRRRNRTRPLDSGESGSMAELRRSGRPRATANGAAGGGLRDPDANCGASPGCSEHSLSPGVRAPSRPRWRSPGPPADSLLHSYGGPAEMVPEFVRLGAYFGFPGYFAHERKVRRRETFLQIPLDRILLKTDAGSMPARRLESISPQRTPEQERP